MWRLVRSERGRERTKEDFSAEMRTNDEFLELPPRGGRARRRQVLGWLRDPELLGRVAEGVLEDEPVRLLSKSWGDGLSIDDVPLLDELRYLLGDPPIVNTGSVDDEWLAAEDASIQEVFTASDREYAGPRGWTDVVVGLDYEYVLLVRELVAAAAVDHDGDRARSDVRRWGPCPGPGGPDAAQRALGLVDALAPSSHSPSRSTKVRPTSLETESRSIPRSWTCSVMSGLTSGSSPGTGVTGRVFSSRP